MANSLVAFTLVEDGLALVLERVLVAAHSHNQNSVGEPARVSPSYHTSMKI